MIKAVFLDLYNTICYFVPPRENRQALACREFGIELEPRSLWLAYVQGEDFWTEENGRYPLVQRSPQELESFYAEYEQRLLAAAGVEVSREQALRIYRRYSEFSLELRLFDDVLPLVDELRARDLIVGLVSNTDKDVAPLCAELGVADRLRFIISSCLVGYEKPDPRIFRLALDSAGVQAREAVHVGDQYKSDVIGARSVGIKPLLLDRYDLLSHLDGCVRIRSLADVLVHIED